MSPIGWIGFLWTIRPGSNAVLHMSRTQFNQLYSCEVRRLTQVSSTDFIWSGWGVLHAWPAVKNAWRPTLGQTPIFTWAEPNHLNDNETLSRVKVWISLKIYESASISIFSNMAVFILSPHVLIIYTWIIAVNVFAYSIRFSQSASL